MCSDKTHKYKNKVPNPYTNKKPCVKCGGTDRYPTYPYQCKPCQRRRANQRNNDLALLGE